MMMTEVRINLNETIRFKPTKRAHEIFFNQLDEICKRYPVSSIRPHNIDVDKDGYASMQLWEFMETFGPHMHIAVPAVCQHLEIVYNAQDEARVMTLEEVIIHEPGSVLWVEEAQGVTWNLFPLEIDLISTHPDTGTDYLFFITYHDIRKFECSEYNQTWRCWTQHPTNEQREATAWNG